MSDLREIAKNAAKPLEMKWRYHGLGLLQGEITERIRLHIWDPDLVRAFGSEAIHDHRFDLYSRILAGSLKDTRFYLDWDLGYAGLRCPVYEIVHAKEQKDGVSSAFHIGHARLIEGDTQIHRRNGEYTIARTQFHRSIPLETTLTIIERSNFDIRPARVLGSLASNKRESDIYPLPPNSSELLGWADRVIRSL